MKATLETPDQMLERLDRLGLDRVKSLLGTDHFDPKTIGLVQGWIKRKEEELNPTPTVRSADEVAQEALQTARQAKVEARKLRAIALKTQRTAQIALAVAGAAIVISFLTLFAFAIR